MTTNGKSWKPEDEEEFGELLSQGWTRTALANHYGVGRDTVRGYLQRTGRTSPAGVFWPGAARRPRHTSAPEADTKGLQEFRDQFLADIRADSKHKAKADYKGSKSGEPHATEVCLFDLHIGKYGWGEETGEDYDTEIAEKRARAAVEDLLSQTLPYRLTEIIVPIGNDLLHYDNLEGTTTAGTIQDRDTRFHRMFRRARGLMAWVIEHCAARAPVRAIIVPGNHDALSAWTLGQVLAAQYANDARVSFDDSSRKRKYHLYGKNLIGFAHGHAEKHARLPQIMAAEVPDLWAQSTTREMHLGHFHRSKVTQPIYVDDHEGCTIRVLRSLSGTDNWHAAMGYVGNVRGAEAFVWRKAGGLRAHLLHQVPDKT